MFWSFAIINGRLAEIYFEPRKKREPKILGYCYVKKEEFKTKREQKYIEEDTKPDSVIEKGIIKE